MEFNIFKRWHESYFHTPTPEIMKAIALLRKFLPQLPHQFVQCHKSYIVNTKKITRHRYYK